MQGTVKTIDGQEIKMVSNAATVYIYKRAFREDIVKAMNDMDGDDAPDFEKIWRLGYIQYLQTKKPFKEILDTVNEDEFVEWLTQFEPNDMDAIREILRLFQGQQQTTVTPKKKHRRRSGSRQQRS